MKFWSDIKAFEQQLKKTEDCPECVQSCLIYIFKSDLPLIHYLFTLHVTTTLVASDATAE